MTPRARVRVEHAGPLTTIQDVGRPGLARYGVPESGPIDRFAFFAALAALKQPGDAAAIELSFGGVLLHCIEGNIAFAVTGGHEACLDGIALGRWTTGILNAGSRLHVRHVASRWGYLALAGNVVAPRWLGSRSTHFLGGLGGGRVVAGLDLIVDEPSAAVTPGAMTIDEDAPIREVAVMLGPQDRYFEADALAAFVREPFTASARFDRMGMAFEEKAPRPISRTMASEPAVRGALQIDGEGGMTLLLADHQTTGGYPKLACVIDAHIDRVAQLPPGAKIRFRIVDAAEAACISGQTRERRAARLSAIRAPSAPLDQILLTSNLIGGVQNALEDKT